jgi:hypothetical protein
MIKGKRYVGRLILNPLGIALFKGAFPSGSLGLSVRKKPEILAMDAKSNNEFGNGDILWWTRLILQTAP